MEVSLPDDQKYQAALNIQQFIYNTQTVGDEMLLCMYEVVLDENVKKTVSWENFEDQWVRVDAGLLPWSRILHNPSL